ncbi:MAG: YfhO family protein [Actinobacteria bacterium]|nr:YfhO family protein [Actinomycetota bacterium]
MQQENLVFLYLYLLAYLSIWIAVVTLYKLSPDLSANLKISIRNMIFPTAIILATIVAYFAKRISVKVFYVLIFLLVFFDLFYFFHKITPFAPASFTYPETKVIARVKEISGINRFWGYGSGYIMPNFQSVDGTYSPEGNDPLHIARYTELLSSSTNGKLPQTLPRPDANIAPGYGPDDLKNNFFRKRVLDLLGIKYILHKVDLKDAWQNPDLSTFPKEQYELVYKTYPWQIYKNKNALPRFFLTSDFVLAKDKKEALLLIYDKNIDLKKTLILEESPSVSLDAKSKGNVKLISYRPNKIEFKVNTSGNTLLFLSDNYYPEWNVTIDGNVSKILIADYTLRAVAVPKGEHTIEFFYNPKSFNLGLVVGLIGIIVLILCTIYVKKYKEKN